MQGGKAPGGSPVFTGNWSNLALSIFFGAVCLTIIILIIIDEMDVGFWEIVWAVICAVVSALCFEAWRYNRKHEKLRKQEKLREEKEEQDKKLAETTLGALPTQ